MAVSQFLSAIRSRLSSNATLLTDASSKEFKQALERWTDLDHKTPGAIIMVVTEDDIVETIKLATSHNIPFVAKAGGHSAWSTTDGIIIDLSNFNKIIINKSNETVRVQGGAQNKQVIDALFADGLLIPLGGGNTIGTIPQAIGGGICALTKLCGTSSDNILSARLITASGALQIVDSSTPDLLWALKGAGQFFGLVTELQFQAFPLDILGSSDGTIWNATYIFSISQAQEVANACEEIVDDVENNAVLAYILTQHPVTREPCLLVLAGYFGGTPEAERFFSPISSLGPIMTDVKREDYTHLNDGIDPFCVKGGFKKFTLQGVETFSAKPWGEMAEIFVQLTKDCDDIVTGGFAFELTAGKQKHIELESAWAHRNVKAWVQTLSWYTNPASGISITAAETKGLALGTAHVPTSEIHTYQNFSRSSSLVSRFGTQERVEKLKALKMKWDPAGIFSGQFIEEV